MMTMLLPIPAKKTNHDIYFLKYEINDQYINMKTSILAKDSDTMGDLQNIM